MASFTSDPQQLPGGLLEIPLWGFPVVGWESSSSNEKQESFARRSQQITGIGFFFFFLKAKFAVNQVVQHERLNLLCLIFSSLLTFMTNFFQIIV